MAGWYIRRGEKVVGPVELAKLQELVAAGRLLPSDHLAKDIEGPWKEAGRTTLFSKPMQAGDSSAKSAPRKPASLVPTAEKLPAAVETPESSKSFTQVGQAIFASIGRGMIATWGTISRSMATRSQRKHELKLAKIQAAALAKSQHPTASQPEAPDRRGERLHMAVPQIHQTTVVRVVNKNTQTVYGCSGCGVILLLILIAIIVAVVASAPTTP